MEDAKKEPLPPAGDEYDVHLFVLVKVKARVHAQHFAEAIERAESLVDPHLHGAFDGVGSVGPLPIAVLDVAYAEEIPFYLVDRPNDPEFLKSKFYKRLDGHSECFVPDGSVDLTKKEVKS